jgi:hypothetical protein
MRWILLALLSATLAHGQLVQEIITNSGGSVTGPFNFTLFDWGACTSGSAPPTGATQTTGCAATSVYPSLPSGASFSITNTNTDLLISNTHHFTYPTFSLTGGAWPNTSTNSLRIAYGGTAGDNSTFNLPTSGIQNTVSDCVPFYTTLPQTTSFTGRIDTWTMGASASQFTNMQLENGGTELYTPTECGVTGTTNCTGGEFVPTGSMPTGTWQIWCEVQTLGANGSAYDAVWNPATGALCDGSSCGTSGTLVSGSLMTNSATATTGLTNIKQETQLGVNPGPTGGYFSWWGPEIHCGLISSQTACGFPVAPGLQLIPPSLSPGSGNYGSGQTVTITNISSVTDSYYYTTCTSAGCTAATPTTGSTLVSGTITATPPEQVCAISARAAPYNNPVSSATCANYIQPNAGYVGSGQCVSASGTATCSNTGLSIPSGDIIIVAMDGGGSGGTNTLTVADSNTDTPTYTTAVKETTNGWYSRMAMFKAGATITSITCTKSLATGNAGNCLYSYYSPGTLSGVVDVTTGQDQPNTTNWTSGSTASLAGAAELIVGAWFDFTNNSVTNTTTDGSTQRVTCSGADGSCGLQDSTAWSTSAASVTGTWNGNNYGTAIVMAIK